MGENCNIPKVRVSKYGKKVREMVEEESRPGIQRAWIGLKLEEKGQKPIGNGFGSDGLRKMGCQTELAARSTDLLAARRRIKYKYGLGH